MDQMAEAYRFWLPEYKDLTVQRIVEVFTTKPQFTSLYPQALFREEGGKFYRYAHHPSQMGSPLVKAEEVSRSVFEAQMSLLSEKLVDSIVGSSATAAAKSSATMDLSKALILGGDWTIGKVIYTAFGNLVDTSISDPLWGRTARKLS